VLRVGWSYSGLVIGLSMGWAGYGLIRARAWLGMGCAWHGFSRACAGLRWARNLVGMGYTRHGHVTGIG
jgi:hypothetical protein